VAAMISFMPFARGMTIPDKYFDDWIMSKQYPDQNIEMTVPNNQSATAFAWDALDTLSSNAQISYTVSTILGGIFVFFIVAVSCYCLYLLLCPKITGFCKFIMCVTCCEYIWKLCNIKDMTIKEMKG